MNIDQSNKRITVNCPEAKETLMRVRRELYKFRVTHCKTTEDHKRLRSINMQVLRAILLLFGEKDLSKLQSGDPE